MRKIRTRLATLFATTMVSSSAWAGQTDEYHGMHMWEGGWHGWAMMPFMMIVVVLAIVAFIFFISGHFRTGGHGGRHLTPTSQGKAPHDILRERFARGEIDKEEFEERCRVLDGVG